MPDGSATAHLYRPKLATIVQRGLRPRRNSARTLLAALTVAIVALPLSMAIAVASGVSPERGLYTAIIGGFLVSALGGSRYQIGGPAGAFIVLVAATVAKFGIEGLLLTVLLSGADADADRGAAAGLADPLHPARRDGRLHLRHRGHHPGEPAQGSRRADACRRRARPADPKAGRRLARRCPRSSLPALAIGIGVGGADLPAALVAPRLAGHADRGRRAPRSPRCCCILPVETIGSRFGGIAARPAVPHLPPITPASAARVLPAALSFTLLGGVESLLSAKVADGMTGRKHRYNMELVAQGIANIASALFGGISVTGTIARTATNIRAGARSPLSGMMHAVFLLLFMLVAAPLASFVPLAALAGVLVVVCWNMAEKKEFAPLLRDWRSAAVLLTTFGLTLLRPDGRHRCGLRAGWIACPLQAARDRRRRVRAGCHRFENAQPSFAFRPLQHSSRARRQFAIPGEAPMVAAPSEWRLSCRNIFMPSSGSIIARHRFSTSTRMTRTIRLSRVHEPRHIHHKAGSIGAGHEHEGQIYLKAVADAAGASHEILITGPGAAKTELMSYLTQHAPETAKRVCGVEALDHPTDNEIVAFARKHFTGIDRMRPQTDV